MAIERLPSSGDMPRATRLPESVVPGGSGDSAGFPWEGRSFEHHGTDFADDDGRTPAGLSDAVDAVRKASDPGELAGAHADAVVALSRVRLLVPLLAETGETGETPDGRLVDKSQELSIVTVAAPDGRRAMPVFSSVETMRAWNPAARPIPVPGPQLALAAAQEGTDLVIIDPGNPDREFGVRRTQLEAMALGLRVLPAWADARVADAFTRSVMDQPSVRGVALSPGDPQARLLDAETVVTLALAPGLDRNFLNELLSTLQDRWARDAVIAERVDSLMLKIRSER